MSDSVRISAPSRLHFGLLRFAQESGRSFGGLGMMIDRPRVTVELTAAPQWSAKGLHADRALEFAVRALDACAAPTIRAAKVEVVDAPASHSGLGSGTQLALAVAAGIRKLGESPTESIERLAAALGRGGRSAVGTHGFERGGVIWEVGQLPGQHLGELRSRQEVPGEWRVVLATFPGGQGLSGEREAVAFGKLPAVPLEVTERLIHLAEEKILPAMERGDFDTFAASIYEYGHIAGNCFAAVQGGPFASPQIAAAIERLRALGVAGVGQSSWGPTIYAFTPDDTAASELIERLEALPEFTNAKLCRAAADNRGARIERRRQRATFG